MLWFNIKNNGPGLLVLPLRSLHLLSIEFTHMQVRWRKSLSSTLYKVIVKST
jgi:hypothetical protein